MKLNDLTPNNPKKQRKRVGHGISAGQARPPAVVPKARVRAPAQVEGSTGKVATCLSSAVCRSYVEKALPHLMKSSSMK